MSIWKKKNIVIFGLFFLIVIFCISFCYLNNIKRDIKLDKVILKTNKTLNKNMFAIMVEKEDGSGYEEVNEFPEIGDLNTELSGCVDIDGKVIKDALSFNSENKSLKIKSKGSIFCYLYFDVSIFDIETNILVKDGNNYKSVSSTPTTDDNYNYNVRYDCKDNDGIVSFGYDYMTHEYIIQSKTKNKCKIYFDEMIPDIKIKLYVNQSEVKELSSTSSYTLNKTLSTCTNSNASIDYDNSTKEVIVSSDKKTECNVYLEGA